MTMMDGLPTNEEHKARHVLEYGVEKTASAFAAMINKEVSPVRVALERYDHWKGYEYSPNSGSHMVLLKTELVGAISGINYFILSQSEMITICNKCMAEDFLASDKDGLGNAKIEFLKEIENVLAAATISEIADKFKIDLFGDVPKIQAVGAEMVDQMIRKEAAALDPKLVLHCNLHIPELGMSPDFLWLFDTKFINQLAHIKESDLLEQALTEK